MSLTKTDLQAIKTLVDDSLDEKLAQQTKVIYYEIAQFIEERVITQLDELRLDIQRLGIRMDRIATDLVHDRTALVTLIKILADKKNISRKEEKGLLGKIYSL